MPLSTLPTGIGVLAMVGSGELWEVGRAWNEKASYVEGKKAASRGSCGVHKLLLAGAGEGIGCGVGED